MKLKGKVELVDALERIIATFGPIRKDSLDDFTQRFAIQNGYTFPENYTSERLVPGLLHSQKIMGYGSDCVTVRPVASNRADTYKTQSAFWVFLEHMNGVDLQTLMPGPAPAQATYLKGHNLYHIVVCDKDGGVELGLAAHLERETSARSRRDIQGGVQEKFILVFANLANASAAPRVISAPCLLAVVQYAPGSKEPTVRFLPAN